MRVTKIEFLPRDIMWKAGVLMRSKGWVQMTGGVLLFCLTLAIGCGPATMPVKQNFIVVYTSQDQIYAEKIFKKFTVDTGIKVKAVFDNESV